jgi:hypothetical protein
MYGLSRGFGAVVIAILPVSLFISFAIMKFAFGKEGLQRWLPVMIGLMSTVAAWEIGRRLNRMKVKITDEEGNSSFRYDTDNSHSLLFIPFEYWAFVYFIGTVWYAFATFL